MVPTRHGPRVYKPCPLESSVCDISETVAARCDEHVLRIRSILLLRPRSDRSPADRFLRHSVLDEDLLDGDYFE